MSTVNNQFIDSSPYSRTFIIGAGNPTQCSVGPKPLEDGVVYSPSVHGASVYNNDTSSYYYTTTTTDMQPGSGDFTIEFWINPTTSVANSVILRTNSKFIAHFNASTDKITFNENFTSTTSIFNGIWTHVAICRNSGVLRMFINGILDVSRSDTSSYTWGTDFFFGTSPTGSFVAFRGYLSGFRFVNGTGLYTTNFIPSYVLSVVSNTVMLLQFANIGIYDASGKSPIVLYGNVVRSVSNYKYGSSALYFPGTSSDYAEVPAGANSSLAIGTSEFTVELWVNMQDLSGGDRILFIYGPIGSTFGIYRESDGGRNVFAYYVNGAELGNDPTSVVANTWYHLALVRRSGMFYFYVNGQLKHSTSTSGTTNFSTSYVILGRSNNPQAPPSTFKGYIDDLRVTKFARYTSNFTPPGPLPLT